MQLDREQFEKAIVSAMSGTSKSQLMRQCALSGPDAQWIKDRVGMSSLEFQALVLGELELVRSRLIGALYDKVDKVTPNYLAQAIGTITDKIVKLHPYASQPDAPAGIRNQVNIQINGSPVNKAQILRELYGNVVDVESDSNDSNVRTGLASETGGRKFRVVEPSSVGQAEPGDATGPDAINRDAIELKSIETDT